MQKTESKKSIIVVDEYGNKLESTYPKRAKGLVKSGRARYVNESTISLISCPPIEKEIKLEDKIMNNNEQKTINQEYILNKIDEILAMNKEAIANKEYGDMPIVNGTKHPIQAICETNNKMIDFLQEMYRSINPNATALKEKAIEGYLEPLKIATANELDDIVENLTNSINQLLVDSKEKNIL